MEAMNRKKTNPIFPSYPSDFSVEILTYIFFYCLRSVIGSDIDLSIWPEGKKYAFTVTHDIDSSWIYQNGNMDKFIKVEKQIGIRGAWYFVVNLYKHDFKVIDILVNEGHEIALHAHKHDHKIAFLSEKRMNKRLSECQWFIDKYQIYGFRSPHYLRTPKFYKVLKHYLKYDTSVHDSYNPASKGDIFREGCSAVTPFNLSDNKNSLLEIPITIPEDFILYNTEKGASSIIEVQLEKVREIKERGGLATLVIHPEPHLSARKPFFEAFKEVLRVVSSDDECWICPPKDIYHFWINKVVGNK